MYSMCVRVVCVFIKYLLQGLTHTSTDIRIAACDVCGSLKATSDPLLSALLPLLLGNTQEKNTAVRASAESSIYQLVRDEPGLAVSCGVVVHKGLNFGSFNPFRAARLCWTDK